MCGDTSCQHPGLARASTGDDEQRAAALKDGATLRFGQVLEQ